MTASPVLAYLDQHVSRLYQDTRDPLGVDGTTRYMRLHVLHLTAATYDSLGQLERYPYTRSEVLDFILKCFNKEDRLFGPYPGADGHVNYTFYCLQLCLTLGLVDEVLGHRVGERTIGEILYESVLALAQDDGIVYGDQVQKEVDNRFQFSFCAILYVLREKIHFQVDTAVIDRVKRNILSAFSNDAFAAAPYMELHAANTYCALCALYVIKLLGNAESFALDHQQLSGLRLGLLKLQTASGGFCGRPEKQPDSCYSQWIGQSLRILDEIEPAHQVHPSVYQNLTNFILECQDTQDGGFSDMPDDEADTWHSHFALNFLCAYDDCTRHANEISGVVNKLGLKVVDPVWDVCVDKLERERITGLWRQ